MKLAFVSLLAAACLASGYQTRAASLTVGVVQSLDNWKITLTYTPTYDPLPDYEFWEYQIFGPTGIEDLLGTPGGNTPPVRVFVGIYGEQFNSGSPFVFTSGTHTGVVELFGTSGFFRTEAQFEILPPTGPMPPGLVRVPDTGATAILLGIGALVLACVCRHFIASAS